MNENNKNYITLNQCKQMIYYETKLIALQFMGTFNLIDVIFDSAHMILCIATPLISILFYLYKRITGNDDLTKYFLVILLLLIPFILLIPIFKIIITNKKQKEMDMAKEAIAMGFFSKTKEYKQDDWVRDKIFENEIVPYIQ